MVKKEFKLGDIVRFKKGDGWDKFLKGNYEVGFASSQTQIKLQSIKNKERLPLTYLAKSLILIRRKK